LLDDLQPDATGYIALIERGTCSFSEKVTNAAAKGAVGTLVHNNTGGMISMGPNPGAAAASIPAYFIRQDDGRRIRERLDAGQPVRARLAAALNGKFIRAYLADVISPGSSRGPSRAGAFKPNLSAPGTEIIAPKRASGDGGVSFSGTSMAAPVVAGGAAVLIERLRSEGLAPADGPLTDPDMVTVADVGAMLMNYAAADVYADDNRVDATVPLARQGAGRMDVARLVRGRTIARAGHIAEIDFGIRAVHETYTDTATVRVRNLGDEAKRYRLSTSFATEAEASAGVSYEVEPAEITVAAGETAEVLVTVRASGAELAPYAAQGGQAALSPVAVSEAEIDGYLHVVEIDDEGEVLEDPDAVRLPIYFLPRPAAAVRAAPDPIRVSPTTGTGTMELRNAGPGEGVARLFHHLGEDPSEADLDPRLDIDHVGVQIERDAQGRRVLSFVLHTTAPRRCRSTRLRG
jgi:minor extracellular serine protease Vpr